jgi:hypothetical protein
LIKSAKYFNADDYQWRYIGTPMEEPHGGILSSVFLGTVAAHYQCNERVTGCTCSPGKDELINRAMLDVWSPQGEVRHQKYGDQKRSLRDRSRTETTTLIGSNIQRIRKGNYTSTKTGGDIHQFNLKSALPIHVAARCPGHPDLKERMAIVMAMNN